LSLDFLHRPETDEGEVDVLHYAMFVWILVNVEKQNHLWLSGVDAETEPHATQSIQQLAHHLLVCREHKHEKVWNMVVSPVTSAKEDEA